MATDCMGIFTCRFLAEGPIHSPAASPEPNVTENPALSVPSDPPGADAAPGSDHEPTLSAVLSDPLPTLDTPLSLDEVKSRLDHAARRGKLPGYHPLSDGFVVDAFGTPFECDLVAAASPSNDAGGAKMRLTFTLRRRRKMPLVFAAALILTVEPGRYFLDQLIPGEWGWIDTRWWYYPLSILPIPLIWRTASKRSNLMARADAHEQIAKIAELLKA